MDALNIWELLSDTLKIWFMIIYEKDIFEGHSFLFVYPKDVLDLIDFWSEVRHCMGEEIRDLTQKEAAYKGVHAVKKLIADLGLPTTLKEIGVKSEEIPKLAEDMITIPWIKTFFDHYTIREMTKDNAIRLLENMWEGTLGAPGSN